MELCARARTACRQPASRITCAYGCLYKHVGVKPEARGGGFGFVHTPAEETMKGVCGVCARVHVRVQVFVPLFVRALNYRQCELARIAGGVCV